MNIKVFYLVSFLYEHPIDSDIDVNFNGDYGETIEIALQNTLKRIDEEWLSKDKILTDYFPQNVQVLFQKSVTIEDEEYFTNRSNSQILIRLNC